MSHLPYLAYLSAFIIIGLFTFFLRAIFLFQLPTRIKESKSFRIGLDSVPSSLLIALVIPFAFFVNQSLDLFRLDVLAIILTIPVILIIKKPGYSLVIAVIFLGFLSVLFSFL